MFKRKKKNEQQHDPYEGRKSPLRASEQETPQPERPENKERDQHDELEKMHPSQAEGERY